MTEGPLALAIGHRFPDLAEERAVLEPLGVRVEDGRGLAGEALRSRARLADALLVGTGVAVDGAFIEGLERCRVIVRYGIGLDNIDQEAAARRRIAVRNVPDYGVEEVSNHALAMLLALHRRLLALDGQVRAGRWTIEAMRDTPRLSTCTLGVVGFGRIGREVARKATAFGLKVLAHDPFVTASPPWCTLVPELAELLGAADFVSLHLPLDGRTRHLFSAATFAQMKPGAFLVNVARGGLVDEEALLRALEEGRLRGAALDVLEAEPPPPHHPLLADPRVILTPHAAWYSTGARTELKRRAALAAAEVLGGASAATPA